MRIILDLSIDPANIRTAQQKGARSIGKHIQFYDKPEVRRSNEMIAAAIDTAMLADHTNKDGTDFNFSPFARGVPLWVDIVFAYTLPKGVSKKHPPRFKPTRPDVDNLAKSVIDQITANGNIWADDSQVCELRMRKVYTPIDGDPFVFVQIGELSNEMPDSLTDLSS